ncbi:MAG: hypothetical protein K0R88_2185 [Solirubrobacterales bacterium]|jgi:hypothetical protein|nr:hypothetical protein [Solirubrobacterales bacterium]
MEGTDASAREAVRGFSRLWWLWIVFGVFWIAVDELV